MSLHNDFNYLSNEIKENYKRQLTRTERKEQEKKKQEKIKKLLYDQFTICFEEVTTQKELYILTKNLIENKSKNILILSEYLENPTKSDIDFIEKIYISVMNEAKKDIEIILKIEKEEAKEQEAIKKEEAKELEKTQKQLEKIQERERKEEARQKQIRERAQQAEWIERQKQKKIAFNMFVKFLYTICILLLSPFLLIGFVVIAICKGK